MVQKDEIATDHPAETVLLNEGNENSAKSGIWYIPYTIKRYVEIEHVEQLREGCLVGKQRRLPFPAISSYRTHTPVEIVHADLCGPITPVTSRGKRYFLLIVDECTRYMFVGVRFLIQNVSINLVVSYHEGYVRDATSVNKIMKNTRIYKDSLIKSFV